MANKGIRTYETAVASNVALGQVGCVYIDGDSAQDEYTGPYIAITALSDAVVDVSECDMSWIDNIAARSGTNDFTIPKGVTIFGYFASIELDSGKVIAYKAA
jgi:hypothetical protein